MPLSLRRQVFATLRPYRVRLGFALVQVVLIGGAELLKPWPLKVIIDNVLGGQRLSWSLVAGCYPRVGGATDAALVAILQQVNLNDLPERVGGFDAEFKWKDLLSLGEQQQIAFARVLLNHPAYAFLDEATSALDSANEELLYG